MSSITCFALKREAAPFRRLNPNARTCILGVGRVNAARALERLDFGSIRSITVAGFSGALVPELAVGQVVEVGEVVDEQGRAWPTRTASSFRLLTASNLVSEPTDKRALGERYHAQLVDMESAEVAHFASEHGMSFRCVRVISDGVDDRLDPALLANIVDGNVRVLPLLAGIITRPKMIPELIHLGRVSARAADALALALGSTTD